MQHSKFDQTLALAGVYQAASLVKQLANQGKANNAQIESSIETLFRFDANTVEEVYGSAADISHGLGILRQQLAERNSRDIDITKYVISLIMLEKKLSNQATMLDKISERLEKTQEKSELFSLSHDNTYAKIAEIYKDTISTLGPKIIVTGDQSYLSNPNNANKVRALLLAGIRSTVLWRQCGGSRWQFIFGRKTYIDECDKILNRI